MAAMQEQNVKVCEKTLKQPQVGTQATIHNRTHFVMTLDRSRSWSGVPVVGSFPAAILPNSSVTFTHLKEEPFGSKAVVVYNGKTTAGTNCSWVLAWHAPADTTPTSPNRVYAICGPKQAIDNLSFDQIQQNLDSASTSVTSPCVDATISDAFSGIAVLIANFKLAI